MSSLVITILIQLTQIYNLQFYVSVWGNYSIKAKTCCNGYKFFHKNKWIANTKNIELNGYFATHKIYFTLGN